MLVINPPMYQILRAAAEEKGVNVKELLRAVVIPEWLRAHNANRASRVAFSMELLDHESDRPRIESGLEKDRLRNNFQEHPSPRSEKFIPWP
jgi:hypothetical protein